MKTCLIRQPAGLGDIFFTLKIAKKILQGCVANVVYWPVIPQFLFIKDYIKSDNIVFCSIDEDFPHKDVYSDDPREVIHRPDLLYLPLQRADEMDGDLILKSKYNIIGAKWGDWYNFFTYERNKQKEDDLYYNVLKLKDNEEYTLISTSYGSPPNTKTAHVEIPRENTRSVFIETKKGFTVFDWCKVIEHASSIHLVDTCFTYICETLDMQAKDLTLYSRATKPHPPSYSQTKFIWRKPWQYKQL
jgi:hypothetical protein